MVAVRQSIYLLKAIKYLESMLYVENNYAPVYEYENTLASVSIYGHTNHTLTYYISPSKYTNHIFCVCFKCLLNSSNVYIIGKYVLPH